MKKDLKSRGGVDDLCEKYFCLEDASQSICDDVNAEIIKAGKNYLTKR